MFDFTRRDFLKGLFAGTAVASFGGVRLFGAEEKEAAVPKLRIGVVSDVHIYMDPKSTSVWEKTLRWYDAQGVDVVLVAGDIADTSQLQQLKNFADGWYKVFPNDKGADGRHVEKFFIQGNHDSEGWKYPKADAEKRKALFESSIMKDIKASWDACFHEEWKEIMMKNVKGYTFIGGHWPHHGKIGEFMAAHKSEIDPKLPFFYTQHPHPKGTCHGPWVWGHDNGASTKTFTEFPNAVVFSGHSHNPLSDEACIWQDSFTSIGTASLRYIGHRSGRVNTYNFGPCAIKHPFVGSGDQQGMLLSVYDDHINIKRRSFAYDDSLGPDWTLPLPLGEKKPYERAHRAQMLRRKLPAFAEDAAEQIVIKENPAG
ncbi:MAG: metallophosphoesterase, partial [Victivallales bacterium]|nr:metallophosphoesterase [Victivallales bacterium]